MTVYGPYVRADGRKHVVHYDPVTKTRRTQSYPRYLIEQHIGRELEDWETVDHMNEDFTDDRLENLQLLSRPENAAKSIECRGITSGTYEFVCAICNQPAQILMRSYKHNQLKQGKAGPFCSRRCAGIYSTRV